MSIASAISAAQQKVVNAYNAVSAKGGTMPLTQDLSNLPSAISSIPTGGGGGVITSLSVTPSTSAQTITATGGIDGYSPINVSAVDSSIDPNILSNNILQGVTILGISGSAVELRSVSLIANPRTTDQTYTPVAPNNGFSSVKVTGVTSSIDANIQAGNIKSGVTILGVTGTYSLPASYRVFELDANGKLVNSTSTPFLPLPAGTTDIGDYCLAYAYYSTPSNVLSGTIDLSSLTNISGVSACRFMFSNCTGITSVDLGSLTTINGMYACSSMFNGCTGITSVDLSSLTTISGSYACQSMFSHCTGITSIDISSLTTISSTNGALNMFDNCNGLVSVTFTSLSVLTGSGACAGMFNSCPSLTSLSFPALTSTSFGSTSVTQFNNLVSYCTGVTIHFPSNLDPQNGSTVISSLTGYPNFGGTNTTLVFDLPATS